MNPIRKLAGETAIYGLSSIVPKFLNYLLVPFHTIVAFQQPGQYGVITELYAYVTFLNILLTYGMETGFFRFSQSEQDKDKVFFTTFLSVFSTSLFFVLVTVFYSGEIAHWLDYGDYPEYVLMFGFILGLDAIAAVPFAGLRQQSRPIRFALIKIGNVLINVFFNLFFLWFCPRYSHIPWIQAFYRPEAGVAYVFLSNLLASAATLLFLLPEVFSYRFRFSGSLLKKLLVYALPLMLAGLAGNVNEAIDRVLLRRLLPEAVDPLAQMGIYGANLKIAVLMVLFIQMFRYAAEPFFFSQVQNKDSGLLIARVMKYFVLFCLFIFLGVTFFLDVLKYFVGPRYWEGLGVVPILLMANMALGIYYNLSIWYKINNMTYIGALIALVGASISILLNILYIPQYGYWASAWTHLISYFCMIVIAWYLGKRYYPIPYDILRITFYIAVAVGLYFISRWAAPPALWLKTLLNIGFLGLFAGLVWYKEVDYSRVLNQNNTET